MAHAFPVASFWGFDYHGPSIETARGRAREEGVEERATFDVAGGKEYPGIYDLICFFDCLRDMGDPVGIAAYAREHLEGDGTVLLVELFALDGRVANLQGNPMAALLYTASTAVCTPNSLSPRRGPSRTEASQPDRPTSPVAVAEERSGSPDLPQPTLSRGDPKCTFESSGLPT
jgi:hypothetical protein